MIYLSRVLDHFWRRWKDYLLELRNSHRHALNKHTADPIAIGDIVLVQEADQPKGFWRLAKVEDLIKGSDGQVRGARVRTQTVGNRPTYLQRPVQLLYPLEVHSLTDSDDHNNTVSHEQRHDVDSISKTDEGSGLPSSIIAVQNAKEILRVLAEYS